VSQDREHYLKRELYELVQKDSHIFEFLEAGSLDGIWYWDLENPTEEWLSPRFKELFGYEDHEVPSTSTWWQQHIFPEDLQFTVDNFNKHCTDPNHPYDQTVRYRHKDGSTVWVRCRGIAIRDETGKAIRMLGA
jgi:PAS domain S-box-containing protein